MKRALPSYLLSATLIGATISSAVTSCQDSNGIVGSDLVSGQLEIVIDSSFALTGGSIVNPRIQSRTTTQLLGQIRANGYGSLRSDFVTQMFPANMIDTIGVDTASIDSVKLLLIFNRDGFVGDSLATLGINVYPLNKELPYPIYSNESPTPYYTNTLLGSTAYTAAGYNDSVSALDYRYIYVNLPKSQGIDIFKKFKANPEAFQNPTRFAREVCPGFYVNTAFGSGRVTRITDVRWVMYYRKTYQATDSLGQAYDSIVPTYGIYMASAPEVIANSHITYTDDNNTLQKEINAGRTIIASPAAYDAEVIFPLDSIISVYHLNQGDLSVINSLSLTIPAWSVNNDKGISMPQNLLMVLSSEKDKFFAANKLPDNVTSFLAEYSLTDSAYHVSEMREYMIKMLAKPSSEITANDSKFTITPIAIEKESTGSSSYYYTTTTSQINAVTPMVALPTMTELFLKRAKIKLVFSKQNIKKNQ